MKRILLIFFLVHLHCLLFAQQNQSENQQPLHFFSTEEDLRKEYFSAMHEASGYINGREYVPYYMPAKQIPFFKNSQGTGTIYIGEQVYNDLIFSYEINLQTLVVASHDNKHQCFVMLNKAMIDSFSLSFNSINYHFVHLRNVSSETNKLVNGFYQVPYKGKVELLVYTDVETSSKEGVQEYMTKQSAYLKTNGDYHKINRKSALLALYKPFKKEIKLKIKETRLNYRHMSAESLGHIIAFAEQIKQARND